MGATNTKDEALLSMEVSFQEMIKPVKVLMKPQPTSKILVSKKASSSSLLLQAEEEREAKKDIRQMSSIMHNRKMWDIFCTFLKERGKQSYYEYFMDLEDFKSQVQDQYCPLLLISEHHRIKSNALKFPRFEVSPENIEVATVLLKSRSELKKLKQQKLVTFAQVCHQVLEAQDVLLMVLLTEYREFSITPDYQLLIQNNSLSNISSCDETSEKIHYKASVYVF
jgi:hypothetical protein